MEQDLIQQYIRHNAFGKLMGMEFTIIEPGKVDYYLDIRKEHLATPNSAHGGVLSALVDGALGVAALSAVHKEAKVVSTIEFKLNFLAPILLGDRVCASAEVVQRGKRILVVAADVRCLNRDNKLVAKAIGTFNAYDAARAGY